LRERKEKRQDVFRRNAKGNKNGGGLIGSSLLRIPSDAGFSGLIKPALAGF
jgi:hypothetical protein